MVGETGKVPKTGRGSNLRGNPYLGVEKVYDNPKDLGFGTVIDRKCSVCFYRDGPVESGLDCTINPSEDPHPKSLFGISLNERLPEKLDNKEVGNYCPYFLHPSAE